ncbi:MAG TPA: DNA polymerase Y family protein [Terriglobales bacterium]
MPFACIFVPGFAIAALLRAEPELRSRPLAVLEGKAPLRKVFAVNEAAQRMGIEPGMGKAEVEACEGLVLRARSSVREGSAHAALLDCAQSFSPRVESIAYGTVVLDLAGLEVLFGPLHKIARDLATRAAELGLESNVAAANNIDTAMVAASGLDGVTVIEEGKEADQIGRLPVEVLLREDSKGQDEIFETFNRWGVRWVHDLAALPDVGVSERLGQQGIYLQQLARGTAKRTLVPVDVPLLFEEAEELEDPLILLEPLAFLLNRMLEQLCARLAARALATQELWLEMELASEYIDNESTTAYIPEQAHSRQKFSRTLKLPVPLLDARTFLKLLQLDLRAHPPGAPIMKVKLTAQPTEPRAAQGGLFLPPSPEPEKLELTLSRIASIVGVGRAGSLQLLDTHRRDGFRMQRFAPGDPQERAGTEKPAGELVTALRIFRPPLVVNVAMRNGWPKGIICRQRKEIGGEVLWAAGPWRSSGDWWEQDPWVRDEWDIAVQTQIEIALYRLVRDVLAGRWVVEGVYD